MRISKKIIATGVVLGAVGAAALGGAAIASATAAPEPPAMPAGGFQFSQDGAGGTSGSVTTDGGIDDGVRHPTGR